MTTPQEAEEVWAAWSRLRDYAIAVKNESLWQFVEAIERELEHQDGMIT